MTFFFNEIPWFVEVLVNLLAAFGLWQLVAIPFYFRKGPLSLRHVEVLPSDTEGVDWAPSGARPLQLIHLRQGKKNRTVVRKCMSRRLVGYRMTPVDVTQAFWEDTGGVLSESELEAVDRLVDIYNDYQARKDEAEQLTKKSVAQLTEMN